MRPIRNRGFTLIEVLVVVAILGILAAIVVPRIMDRPDEAKRVAARADIGAMVHGRFFKRGLNYWAVSDLAGDELDEFVQKISAALRPSGPS